MNPGDRPLLGIQAMLAATFFYTLCDALGKWVLTEQSVFMLLFVRSIAAGLIVAFLLARGPGFTALWRVPQPRLVVLRIVTATAETTLFFVAVQYLSLVATLSIYLAAPLLVAVLAPWMLGERFTFVRFWGCVAGFGGVLLLLRPGGDSFQPAALVALVGMVSLAITLLTARSLKSIEPMVLVAHQIVGTLLVGTLGLLLTGGASLAPLSDTLMMAAVGISAMVAQFFVAWSMRLAPASLVSPFFYSAMVWALLADAIVWHVFPTPLSLAGAMLIVGSGLWLGRQST